MSDFAVIGDFDTTMAFEAAGAKTYEANTGKEAIDAVMDILNNQIKLALISETLRQDVKDILDDNSTLVYLYIPPIRGATGEGSKSMQDIIQKAIGVKH